jgi:hypothetical protein
MANLVIHIGLFLLGTAMAVFGLLHAAHEPFQRWWYGTEWCNPGKKRPVDVSSDEYKIAIANMKIAGSKFAGTGGLLMIYSLSILGGERLLLIAGILFVCGLLFVGVMRIWKTLTSRK